MTGLEAWIVAQFTPDNIRDILGITFLVLWVWSERLSFDQKTCANGVIQKFAPLIKALGEKMAPPAVTAAIEATCGVKSQTDTPLPGLENPESKESP